MWSHEQETKESYKRLNILDHLRDRLVATADYKSNEEAEAIVWAIATLTVSNPFCKGYEHNHLSKIKPLSGKNDVSLCVDDLPKNSHLVASK